MSAKQIIMSSSNVVSAIPPVGEMCVCGERECVYLYRPAAIALARYSLVGHTDIKVAISVESVLGKARVKKAVAHRRVR